jgi:beta-N-acetylhexosaminidase
MAAGCDWALQCNGDLAEMAQVAEAAGDMGQAARRRAQAALAWRKPAAPVDISILEAELAGLMKDAPHVQNGRLVRSKAHPRPLGGRGIDH